MRLLRSRAVVCVAALVLCCSFLSSCGSSGEKMQAFADECAAVVHGALEPPESAERGMEAARSYYTSDFSDLEGAKILEEISRDTADRLESFLDRLNATAPPDPQAEEVATLLRSWLSTQIDFGTRLTQHYGEAPNQDVSERRDANLSLRTEMAGQAEAGRLLVEGLAQLHAYIEANELEGGPAVQEKLDEVRRASEVHQRTSRG